MQAKRLVRRRGNTHRLVLAMVPLLALRDHLPVVPTPREDRGGMSWRPVLFGLGAAVGFAIALGRTRNVEAPGLASSPSGSGGPGRVESAIGRSIHLPSPLKDSIEAELSTDGPVLFSPPDAIDPVGTENSDAGESGDAQGDEATDDATGVA